MRQPGGWRRTAEGSELDAARCFLQCMTTIRIGILASCLRHSRPAAWNIARPAIPLLTTTKVLHLALLRATVPTSNNFCKSLHLPPGFYLPASDIHPNSIPSNCYFSTSTSSYSLGHLQSQARWTIGLATAWRTAPSPFKLAGVKL